MEQMKWEEALSRVEDECDCCIAATGPRREQNWQQDAVAVMRREVRDPRGWRTIDDCACAHEASGNPSFPFQSPDAEKLAENTYPITIDAATSLLTLITDQWFRVSNFVNSGKNRDLLLVDARFILARYGPDAQMFTTSGDARSTMNPDFSQSAQAGHSFSNYIMEIGLIAVSDTEVGVFWGFNAD
ncbi:hypothetical protein [Streptomyces montanisoli]|uniref:Uncharacterized protein n=1 Tax=Streptomyces montanisoli TaxID=2798581 RepID=A0A940MJC0_9ACTN|nr:hypothetical protein [Streptomyces montanisoli]MBP0461150.1 hypothetical protein [Streptomyces montanisoli]